MKNEKPLKVFIRTYGCQMNERDSEAALASLLKRGYLAADTEEDADVLIFNTCSVRDQAERKAMGKIGIVQRLKREKPDLMIGVMGCMAQSRGPEILKKNPHVNFVVGTDQLHHIADTVDQLRNSRRQVLLNAMDAPEILTAMSDHLSAEPDAVRVSASVAISRGCSRHCAYCIVPSVRGPEKSRTPDDILAEIRSLVDTGIREVLLLGQNVAAYGYDNTPPPMPPDHSPFADLLVEISKIDALKRIRFTSPHPAYFNQKLMDTIAALPKVCRHIHLPVQSGSDAILKKMNRPYTQARYLEIIDQLRERMPEVSFSTDIIVGFPGETDADFEETRKVMQYAAYSQAFIFKYSPRKDTRAAVMPDQIPTEVKEVRNHILLNDLAQLSKAHNARYVGRTVEVLVEGPSKRNETRWAGRTDDFQVVVFPTDDTVQVGDLIRVKIERATGVTLYGTLA